MRFIAPVIAIVMSAIAAPVSAQGPKAGMIPQFEPDPKRVERGRYLAAIAGCNDCHTPGYVVQNGKVSEDVWLIGDKLGWRGPWGTTYASNLRLAVKDMREKDWLDYARKLETRPPMPWFTLRIMHEDDLRAIFHFIKSLQPEGEPAPEALPPGKEPPQPYVQFPAAPQ